MTYLSSSVNLGAISSGDCRRAENRGGSEDVGGGGSVWDRWDDGGLGATAVGDCGRLESGESVGFRGTGDGGTGGTARDGGSVYDCGGCVRGSRRANCHGVVSSPSICNTGDGSENEDCRLHFDFGFWDFLYVEGRLRAWGLLKRY